MFGSARMEKSWSTLLELPVVTFETCKTRFCKDYWKLSVSDFPRSFFSQAFVLFVEEAPLQSSLLRVVIFLYALVLF